MNITSKLLLLCPLQVIFFCVSSQDDDVSGQDDNNYGLMTIVVVTSGLFVLTILVGALIYWRYRKLHRDRKIGSERCSTSAASIGTKYSSIVSGVTYQKDEEEHFVQM